MAEKDKTRQIQPNLVNLNVLVVEDSTFDRELTIAMLRKLGVTEIQLAESGRFAMNKIQNAAAIKKPFDIVFLDAKLPNMDGLGLLKWLRSDFRLRTQKVIMTTVTNDLASVAELIEQGVNAYVVKPFSLATLHEKILQTLSPEVKKNAG